jgi:hypothetical protein
MLTKTRRGSLPKLWNSTQNKSIWMQKKEERRARVALVDKTEETTSRTTALEGTGNAGNTAVDVFKDEGISTTTKVSCSANIASSKKLALNKTSRSLSLKQKYVQTSHKPAAEGASTNASASDGTTLSWLSASDYSDPQGQVQGPFRFSPPEMRVWLVAGHFDGALSIRRGAEGGFVHLETLYHDITTALLDNAIPEVDWDYSNSKDPRPCRLRLRNSGRKETSQL